MYTRFVRDSVKNLRSDAGTKSSERGSPKCAYMYVYIDFSLERA